METLSPQTQKTEKILSYYWITGKDVWLKCLAVVQQN